MKYGSQSHILPWNLFSKCGMLALFRVFLVVVSLEIFESGFVVKTLPGLHDDIPFTLETGIMKYGSQSHILPWNLFSKCGMLVLFRVFLVVVSLEIFESGFVVKTLPGLHDDIPFTLETGIMKYGSQSHILPWNLFSKCGMLVLFRVFLVVVSLEIFESGFVVKTLPGLHDDIPFTLETGYIGVGESDDVQLFYYFVESQGNPKNDPLMIWLTGGPGCSALCAIVNEIGPFTINYENSTLEKQILEISPHTWTKVASIIFIDHPAGSGYSYAKTSEAYVTNDTLSTMHAYQFLRKWLVDHPKFLNNPFYVGADSYSGFLVPMIVHEIYNGIEIGEGPKINIKGYVIGNPGTDTHGEFNSRIPYAHHMALLSGALYKSAKENCHGDYVNVDPNNSLCMHDLRVIDKNLRRIYKPHILEPSCDTSNTIEHDLFKRDLRSLENTSVHILSLPHVQKRGCREDHYIYTTLWANSREVQEALHIREEFKKNEWVLCNQSLVFELDREPISYTHNVRCTVSYHQHLTHRKCRSLVYSGDHDMYVPYLGTLNWIKSLNLLCVDDWRPWFVDEQVAGYTMKYSHHEYNLTFATVKGGGHTVPEFKPKESLSMLVRWLANDSL